MTLCYVGVINGLNMVCCSISSSFFQYSLMVLNASQSQGNQLCVYVLLCLKDFPLNPKALSLGELYGEFDLNTNEWTDGILSSVMRQTCAGW